MLTEADPPTAALGDDDAAELERRVDAMALSQQLRWLARSTLLLPTEALWGVLALNAGLAWGWVAVALSLRMLSHVRSSREARRLQPLVHSDPSRGVRRVRRLYWAFGLYLSLILPVLLIGSDDTTKLLAMLLAAHYAGIVVIAAAGDQAMYWGTTAPFLSLMVIGWLMRGGPLGWILASMSVLTVPMTILSLRFHRQSMAHLVRVSMENERLAASLAIERDRARAAADARTRFFAAASHDLRQPLHALAIHATTLELLAPRSGDARLVEVGHGIGRALAQSQGLLDALLDVSRLDAGAVRVHPAPTDLRALLQQLQSETAPLAAQRGLALELSTPATSAWAHTDTDQLMRILRNLVDNALKFTAHGQITLALAAEGRAADDPGSGRWALSVTDTGRGIAEADRERVFEEFYQAGNPTRDRSLGLGLGLAIVRRTATLIGAQVTLAASAPGAGSRFVVSLPAVDEAAAEVLAQPTTSATAEVGTAPNGAPLPSPPNLQDGQGPGAPGDHRPSHRPLSVLVVDDEADIRQALAGLLSTLGWQPHLSASGSEALALAAQPDLPLDVALVDHRLPGGDGLALVQRLRALRPGLPAVIVSGDAAAAAPAALAGLPLLHKPLDGHRLVQAVRAVLPLQAISP